MACFASRKRPPAGRRAALPLRVSRKSSDDGAWPTTLDLAAEGRMTGKDIKASGTPQSVLILIAYSDSDISANLARSLSEAALTEVITAPLSRVLDGLVENVKPDLVLLEDSSNVEELVGGCQEMRQSTQRPVVVLSKLSDELGIARALDAGVDGYLVLPVSDLELQGRVHALLRRRARARTELAEFVFGELSLSVAEQRVELAGRSIDLTPTEFRLLAVLVAAQGSTVTHDHLMVSVWGEEYFDSRHYLHLYIRYLRDKLEDVPKSPQLIMSERGLGYRLGVLPTRS